MLLLRLGMMIRRRRDRSMCIRASPLFNMTESRVLADILTNLMVLAYRMVLAHGLVRSHRVLLSYSMVLTHRMVL